MIDLTKVPEWMALKRAVVSLGLELPDAVHKDVSCIFNECAAALTKLKPATIEQAEPTAEQFRAGIQKVLDTPGYDREAMEAATKLQGVFGMSLQMSQDISAYYHTEHNTNGKTFEYLWD